MTTKFKMQKLENGNIRTCEVRLSFPELFTPVAMEEGKPKKYSTATLFPEGADLSVLKDEIKRVIKEEWGDKVPKGLRIGLRDQGEKDFEGYIDGAFFLNCNSTRRPSVVDRKREAIVEEDEIYPGLNAIVTLKVYAFRPKKKTDKFGPGIGFGLQAVQSLGFGERLGGGVSNPNEEFEELEDLAEGDSADSVFDGGDDSDAIDDIFN